jgi:hypothetical protein
MLVISIMPLYMLCWRFNMVVNYRQQVPYLRSGDEDVKVKPMKMSPT